jgi:hypothetical protein
MSDAVAEPANIGPIAGANLRASDADRDQVATVLSTAYAEGRLTREEHEERLGQVLAARTFEDLIPITSDLVPATPPGSSMTRGPANSSYTIDTAQATEESDTMIAVFGAVTRTGRWRVRKHAKALALFGGIDLDLRDAVFEDALVEISGIWCFGGLDIKVPGGMQVRDQTAGIFGGTDVRDLGEPQPGAPTLVIKGMAVFGGVSVRGPRPQKPKR